MVSEGFERMFGVSSYRGQISEMDATQKQTHSTLKGGENIHAKLHPRETLYVSTSGTHAEGSDAEWIVSYSSGAKTSDLRPTVQNPAGAELRVETDDVYLVVQPDAFNIARIVISRLLSVGGKDRLVRLFCTMEHPESIQKAFGCILIASNLMKLSCFVTKKSQESADMIFVLQLSRGEGAKPGVRLQVPGSMIEDVPELASRIFEKLYIDRSPSVSLELVEESHIVSVLRAASVICYEAMLPQFDSIPPVLRLELQPSAGGSIISASVSEESNYLSEILKTSPDFEKFAVYMSNLNALEGATVLISSPDSMDLEAIANTVIRVFMSGYCSVQVQALEGLALIAELVLLIVKYFEVSLELNRADSKIILCRKCASVDPFISPVGAKNCAPPQEPEESSSATEQGVVSTVLSALAAGPVSVSVLRSVERVKSLVACSIEAGEMRYHFFSPKKANEVVVRIVPLSKLGDVDSILAKLNKEQSGVNLAASGDVSPSNYRPVDAALRFGSEAEIEALKQKLYALTETDETRLSVLLVGPRNIGQGIRLLCCGGADSKTVFEFVSERAVRDAQGASLKCAVRLFIKKQVQVDNTPSLEDLIISSETVQVSETDSRITIANQLFTLLNEAVNGIVLIRAESDYCAFIAAMSVVVANGWSRTIHQRVETKAVLSAEKVVYLITRLIVNTV